MTTATSSILYIDLSVPCRLPFTGAENMSPGMSGIVKLEKRGEDLYLDNNKFYLFLPEKQAGEKLVFGYDLCKEIEIRGGNTRAKILDALCSDPTFWPESWKKGLDGKPLYVSFWGDTFRDPSNNEMYVRYGSWYHNRRTVSHYYYWLGSLFGRERPVASIKISKAA